MTFRAAERVLTPRVRRLGFEALAVAAGQAAAAAGAVIGVRVLTEAMPPHAYGELALAVTIGTLGLQVLLAPLSTSALRFFAPAQEAGDLRGFFAAVRRLIAACSALVGILAVLTITGVIAASRPFLIGLVVAAFAFTLFSGISGVLDGIQNAARHRVVAAAHSGLGAWIRFLAAVAVMRLLATSSSAAAMTGYAIAAALVCLSQLYFTRRQIVPLAGPEALDEKRWMRDMLAYGWPFAAWGIFGWAQLASDRWALGLLASTEQVGYYAVIYQLGFYPILTASVLIGQVFSPVLYARAGDATDPARVAEAIRLNRWLAVIMVALTIAGAGVMALIHQFIGRLFLAPEYRGVTHYLPWMLLAGGLYATGQIASIMFMLSNRSAELTVPKVSTAILGVAANFAGAKWAGVAGVIGAMIAFGLVYCLWIVLASSRLVRRQREAAA